MKKIMIMILCLAFFSQACLGSAAPLALAMDPTMTSVPHMRPPSTRTASAEPTITAMAPGSQCVKVVAIDALHLRKLPNVRGAVVRYLVHDEILRLIRRTSADWWLVSDGSQRGYARSKYLEESECE